MAAMRLPSSLLAALVWLMVPVWASAGASAQSDFMEGLAAYDAGDYRTALEEWRTLAETGDAEAQTALAGLYLDGLGTAVDAAAALRWYRRAVVLNLSPRLIPLPLSRVCQPLLPTSVSLETILP